jgi:DnaK suppressor protein
MNSQLIEELTARLYRQRSSLLESAAAENRETAPTDERESEIEESAQIDRITQLRNQLDERGQMMIREIEAALERVDSGTYGLCRKCNEEIAAARLRALPTAILCIDCAKAIEKKRLAAGEDRAERLPVAYDDFEDGSYGEEGV